MLEQSPSIADRIAGQYDHILVDEYQDTNLLQARILRGMCRQHRNITVVGDDAQSIYSFRGASFRNILDFPKQFEGTTIVALEQNYRSTQPILDVTNTLISRALERFTKDALDAARRQRRRRGSSRRATNSSRRGSSSTAFSSCTKKARRSARSPCSSAPATCRPTSRSSSRTGRSRSRSGAGSSSSRRRTSRTSLAFLRVLDNPRDEVSWYRILMLMPGIGDVTARAIMASMADRVVGPERVRALRAAAARPRCASRARRAAAPAARHALRRPRRRRRRGHR